MEHQTALPSAGDVCNLALNIQVIVYFTTVISFGESRDREVGPTGDMAKSHSSDEMRFLLALPLTLSNISNVAEGFPCAIVVS